MKALYGGHLTFNEFITIDKTALGDLLQVRAERTPGVLAMIELTNRAL